MSWYYFHKLSFYHGCIFDIYSYKFIATGRNGIRLNSFELMSHLSLISRHPPMVMYYIGISSPTDSPRINVVTICLLSELHVMYVILLCDKDQIRICLFAIIRYRVVTFYDHIKFWSSLWVRSYPKYMYIILTEIYFVNISYQRFVKIRTTEVNLVCDGSVVQADIKPAGFKPADTKRVHEVWHKATNINIMLIT